MLKYFGGLFFVLTILSAPSLAIYSNNLEIKEDSQEEYQNIMYFSSLGHLGIRKTIEAVAIEVGMDDRIQMDLTCPGVTTLKNFLHYGLALTDNKIVGQGIDTTVITDDPCSYGTQPDSRNDRRVDLTFDAMCRGKNSCGMNFKLEEVFDQKCRNEIGDRYRGKLDNGPPRVYVLALCTSDQMNLFDQFTISREESSIIIACLEVLIMAVFAYLITRLDFYEKLATEDMRYG